MTKSTNQHYCPETLFVSVNLKSLGFGNQKQNFNSNKILDVENVDVFTKTKQEKEK